MPAKENRYANTRQIADKLVVGKPIEKPLLKQLTTSQEKFAQLMASEYFFGDITKKEAATKAGYSEKNATKAAYELTNPKICPHVTARILELQEEHSRKYGITFEKHIRDLQKIRDAALTDKSYAAAVSAEYRRGQAQGDIYVTKIESKTGKIDGMTREEVLEELKALGIKTTTTVEGVAERVEDVADGEFTEIKEEDQTGEHILAEEDEPDDSELQTYLEGNKG